MTFSGFNPLYGLMMRGKVSHRIDEEVRLANDLQNSIPEMTRPEALREAARLLAERNPIDR